MTGFKMNKIENKWLQNKWLILASLLLNLFLIGCLVGGTYKLIANHQAAKVGQNSLRFAAENLSHEQQHNFKKTLRKTRHETKLLFTAANDARTKVRKLIAAQSFDRQSVEVALAKTGEADRAIRMKIETSMLNYVQSLSAEDRQKFADGLAKNGPLREHPMIMLKDD
jgi:uncharacterized membrane protein